jgi:hypothetical protein
LAQFKVGFIGTLLLGTTLAWFTPLLEHQSPLFNNFKTFIEKFNATFGNSNKEHTSKIKIQPFCQRSPLVVVYASKFKQLACIISWGETMFISQF